MIATSTLASMKPTMTAQTTSMPASMAAITLLVLSSMNPRPSITAAMPAAMAAHRLLVLKRIVLLGGTRVSCVGDLLLGGVLLLLRMDIRSLLLLLKHRRP